MWVHKQLKVKLQNYKTDACVCVNKGMKKSHMRKEGRKNKKEIHTEFHEYI